MGWAYHLAVVLATTAKSSRAWLHSPEERNAPETSGEELLVDLARS
jgi:hypothetical protein